MAIATELEKAVREELGITVNITILKGEVIIYGLKSNLQEAQVWLFIHGYLACIRKRSKSLRIHDPEVG